MATKMTMVTRADLDALLDVAGEWLQKEQAYTVPDDRRQRWTSAAKRRAAVREIVERNRSILRIFGG